MGATGTGKSKLSIDVASRFFPSEIINSDKIQVYKGLDNTANKISMSEGRGIFHHLLGEFSSEFSPSDFSLVASDRISDTINRNNLPLIVGGSNPVQCVSKELRYNCCFIWIDVLTPVLNQYLYKRVDEMMKSGMYEELEEFVEKNGFSGSNSAGRHSGLRKAMGVPEMERYFEKYRNCTAVKEIKENTRQLAEKQIWKIQRLDKLGGTYKELMPRRQSPRRPRYGINKW